MTNLIVIIYKTGCPKVLPYHEWEYDKYLHQSYLLSQSKDSNILRVDRYRYDEGVYYHMEVVKWN